MITITLQSENGADARKELSDLLGLSGVVTAKLQPIEAEAFKTQMQIPVTEAIETAAEETTKKKRRTKAEIEAEEKANAATEEVSDQAQTMEQDNADQNKEVEVKVPELVDLQRICAILVRAGYKKEGVDFIKNIGGADSSKEVPEAKRQDVIDAMTTFATEKQITVA